MEPLGRLNTIEFAAVLGVFPQLKAWEFSAQIGSGVQNGPESRLYEASTRVPPHAVGDIT